MENSNPVVHFKLPDRQKEEEVTARELFVHDAGQWLSVNNKEQLTADVSS